MEKIKLHKCSRCGRKIRGKAYYCPTCQNAYQKKYRERKREEDMAMYFLDFSCQNAFKRGQKKYVLSPYEHVDCEWRSAKEMLKVLSKHEPFFKKWKEQTEVFKKTGNDYDKPSIDRIDNSRGYYLDNIQCLSLGANKTKGSGNSCFMMILKNIRPFAFGHYLSMTQALRDFKLKTGIDVPYNILRKNVNDGQIHEVGDGYSMLFQSENGIPKSAEESRYLMVVDHKRYLVNEQTHKEKLLNQTQYQIPVSGLWIDKLNKKNSDVSTNTIA